MSHDRSVLVSVVHEIHLPDIDLYGQAQARQGASPLGDLDVVAHRIAAATGTRSPSVMRRALVIFAGDHGSSSGPDSAPRLAELARGDTRLNALASASSAAVVTVDMGVATDPGQLANVWPRRVGNGARDFTAGPAMSEDETMSALEAGVEVAEALHSKKVELFGVGALGRGSDASASAIAAALTERPAAEVTASENLELVERALARHTIRPDQPLDLLTAFGGFEIAAICGACLGAASTQRIAVVDGFAATVGAALAVALAPATAGYLVAGHRSQTPGHDLLFKRLGLSPLLDLGATLTEGAGAALALGLIGAAVAAFSQPPAQPGS